MVGFFAFLIANWNGLAKIIYLSFSGIGLKAAGSGNPDDLLHPGRIAKIGIDAGRPLLDQASLLAGPVGVFTNLADIAVLLLAFAIVRSEEHTSELQSLMRISYAVFCLKKKKQT